MKTRIMTVDLENDLRSDHCKSIELVMPKLLNFFDDHKITATFFTVTKLLNKYESEIKEISKKHEISSHSHSHSLLNNRNAEFEIKTSMEKMKEYGLKCNGFRAPEFVFHKDFFSLLQKHGYSYDSSLATFLPGRYSNLDLPRMPFLNRGILEFPVPTFIYPSVNAGLPYLKLFHPVSNLFSQRYLFYLHPWELLEKKCLPPTKSVVAFLLKRNSGQKAWQILEEYVTKNETKWVSCKEWMEKNGK